MASGIGTGTQIGNNGITEKFFSLKKKKDEATGVAERAIETTDNKDLFVEKKRKIEPLQTQNENKLEFQIGELVFYKLNTLLLRKQNDFKYKGASTHSGTIFDRHDKASGQKLIVGKNCDTEKGYFRVSDASQGSFQIPLMDPDKFEEALLGTEFGVTTTFQYSTQVFTHLDTFEILLEKKDEEGAENLHTLTILSKETKENMLQFLETTLEIKKNEYIEVIT